MQGTGRLYFKDFKQIQNVNLSTMFLTNARVNESQLPGTLRTVVCIALLASVKYRGCIP